MQDRKNDSGNLPDEATNEHAKPLEKTLPFILDFIEERKGAVCGTTSGTWEDIDCADVS
ncbi:MAG: hypothetical protein HQ536_05240 [Parcubacteria group bacterium]|nr:hypothetical protein [Parcubacteria group bacterium]